jgi:hypothetical protein
MGRKLIVFNRPIHRVHLQRKLVESMNDDDGLMGVKKEKSYQYIRGGLGREQEVNTTRTV